MLQRAPRLLASMYQVLAPLGFLPILLIFSEARRLGTERTLIVHAVGIALAATSFVLLLVMHGSDKVGIGLYLVLLAWSLGGAAAGSFGGVTAAMAFALIAMVHGIWGAAIASGVRDAGQAYIAIFSMPLLLVPVLAIAAFGRWLGGSLHSRRSHDGQGSARSSDPFSYLEMSHDVRRANVCKWPFSSLLAPRCDFRFQG